MLPMSIYSALRWVVRNRCRVGWLTLVWVQLKTHLKQIRGDTNTDTVDGDESGGPAAKRLKTEAVI